MECPANLTELDTLRRCWRDWSDVVELFARRRRTRCRVNPQAYAILHQELIASCLVLAERADSAKQAYYQGLLELSQPWLTVKVLAQTDQEILSSLLSRCRRVEQELGSRSWDLTVRHWAVGMLVGLVCIGLLGLLACTVTDWAAPVRQQIDCWWRSIRHVTRFASVSQLSFLIGAVPILVALGLLARGLRE